MKRRQLIGVSLMFWWCAAHVPSAQTDPTNVPRPPTAELRKLERFLGLYEQTMQFAGLAWSGTLEVRPAVKGWYIEWVIDTHHEHKIDRQLRMLMTWDRNLGRYRIWRFATVDPEVGLEGEGRFQGSELLMEWRTVDPRTPERRPALYRNRIRTSYLLPRRQCERRLEQLIDAPPAVRISVSARETCPPQ